MLADTESSLKKDTAESLNKLYPDAFIKVRCYDDDIEEVRCLTLLNKVEPSLVPKLITSGISGAIEWSKDHTVFITYLVIEHCGTSLDELYLNSDLRDKIWDSDDDRERVKEIIGRISKDSNGVIRVIDFGHAAIL
jgi:hypothetical protein